MPQTADVRFVLATNKDLKALMQQGAIREDFYYRVMGGFTIHVPPLQERQEDIPLLVDYFVQQHAETEGQTPRTIPGRILDLLSTYDWPGNVRELRAQIFRYLNGQSFEFTKTQPQAQDQEDLALSARVDEFEKGCIVRMLQQYQGNKKASADALGIDRKTLYTKLKKYGI